MQCMKTIKFEGIGTLWQIDLYSSVSDQELGYLEMLILKRVEEFERNYSRFRYDSFTNITLQERGTFNLPHDAEPLFSLYQKLYHITDGAFTPFIGQVLADAGYDAAYSFKSKALSTPPRWEDTMDYHYPTVTIKKPEILDFGAGGKGYLIDIISDLIKENGALEFCIDAGGDIRYEGAMPFRVGLENPNNLEQAIGIVTLSQTSLCASAGSRRKWGTFHHIINPHTLSSPSNIIATWTLAKDTLTADALSTSLFLVSPQKLLPHFDFEYLTLFADNSFEKSPSFPAELFLK